MNFFYIPLLFIILSHPFTRNAIAGIDLENLEAAFIYKFTNYIEWPDKENEIFSIAVLNDKKKFNSINEAFKGQTIHDKKISITHLNHLDPATSFDILCIDRITPELSIIIKTLSQKGLLVITHSKEMHSESSINFYVSEENQLKFEINLPRALDNKLKINSRLLNLSRSQR